MWENVRKGKKAPRLKFLKTIAIKEYELLLSHRMKPIMIKSHKVIVQDWKTKVNFNGKRFQESDRLGMYVSPRGAGVEIYTYVDQGTEPHTITNVKPKNAKLLSFKSGGKYNAKTAPSPGRATGGSGRVSGGQQVFASRVDIIHHPGSEARKFSEEIAKEILPVFRREMALSNIKIARIVNNE